MKSIKINYSKFLMSLIFCIGVDCPIFAQEIVHRNYDALQGLSSNSMFRFDNGDIAQLGTLRFYLGNDVSTDPMFMKTDSMGNVKWALRYDMQRDDIFTKAVLLPNQNLIAIGNTTSFAPFGIYNYFDTLRYNILIAKIDSSGTPVQVVVYGDTLQDAGNDLIYSNSGDIIMLAMTNYNHSIDVKRGNMLVARIDTNLNITTSKEFYFGSGVRVLPSRIVESGGHYYATGIFSYTDTIVNWSDAFLIKLNHNFDIIWSIRMGSDENYFHTRILPHPDNGVFIGFITTDYGTGPAYTDFVISHIDSTGQVGWSKKYGGIQFGDDQIDFMMYNFDSSKVILGSGPKFIDIDHQGVILGAYIYSTGISTLSVSGISAPDGAVIFNCRSAGSANNSTSFLIADSSNVTCSGGAFSYPSTSVLVSPVSIALYDSLKWLSYNQQLITTSNIIINTITYCSTSIGLPDDSFIQEVHLFPNPTHDLLNILFKNQQDNGDLKISICDQFGRKVFIGDLRSNEIDLGPFNSGIYIIEIVKDNKTYFLKILKL